MPRVNYTNLTLEQLQIISSYAKSCGLAVDLFLNITVRSDTSLNDFRDYVDQILEKTPSSKDLSARTRLRKALNKVLVGHTCTDDNIQTLIMPNEAIITIEADGNDSFTISVDGEQIYDDTLVRS